jgi:hypothetical protein
MLVSIEIHLKETGFDDVDRIFLAQTKDHRQVRLNIGLYICRLLRYFFILFSTSHPTAQFDQYGYHHLFETAVFLLL